MRRLGVIGWPLRHTDSPRLWRKILQAAGRLGAFSYAAYPVAPADLGRFMTQFRADRHWQGVNVTIPHKRSVIQWVDELTPRAARAGAVNTVFKKDGRVWGDNTDGVGFERSMGRWWPHLEGRRALLFGTGGAAAAIAAVLDKRGIGYATVSRRPHGGTFTYDDLRRDPTPVLSAGWLINATPCGMPGYEPLPIDPCWILPTHRVFDAVYAARPTPLVRAALRAGAAAMDGRRMLWEQALEAARRWGVI